MSLFGDAPDEVADPTQARSSLFADEPVISAPSNALFADDSEPSPWTTPNPKRAARHELVKMLLPASEVPETYINAYDTVLNAGERSGEGVSVATAKKMLESTELSEQEQSTILNMVVPGGEELPNGLGHGEFNVLFALIGLAHEGEDLTFDTIDERRKNLPTPHIKYIDELRPASRTSEPGPEPSTPRRSNDIPSESRGISLNDPEADPWASPEIQDHAHPTDNTGANGDEPAQFLLDKNLSESHSDRGSTHNPIQSSSRASQITTSGWGDAFPAIDEGFGVDAGFGNNIGSPICNTPNPGQGNVSRSIGGGRIGGSKADEVVTITMLPEKEGLFMFQHRNYEVKTLRRASSVIRRYSDFVWLSDCLQRKYPFRRIPLLPPKRVGVNGTHLAADSNSFLDKRRRGLVRFANSLVQHPVLSQEQLVVMFLTVPTELSVWRKQAAISVQEEFALKPLPPDLEDSLPPTLEDTFVTVRAGIKRSADIYISLCNLLDRLSKRNEGLAADQFRFARALQNLAECTADTYAIDTNDGPLLNNGIHSTARRLMASQGLLEDEARTWNDGVLEDLKRQRDCLVAMRDLFDRKDRYARDNIPQLERRISNNERKLENLRAREEGTVKPGELERVEDAIVKDKQSIVEQHERSILIKECVRDELLYFQASQYQVTRLHQDWSQERVKYSELQADNWRALGEELETMPTGD